jgi:hypothetical protein
LGGIGENQFPLVIYCDLLKKVFDPRFAHQPAADTFAKAPKSAAEIGASQLNLGGKQTSIRYCFSGIPILAHRAIPVYIDQ